MSWHYLWWVPCAVVYYGIYSWMSKQNNDIGGKWIWFAFAWGAVCPLWIVVSRISKNLLFDGMLYDNLMFLTYVGTMLFLGAGAKLAAHQWLGLAMIVAGSVLIRVAKL
jgi:cytochrome c biogenesis protein CcdA